MNPKEKRKEKKINTEFHELENKYTIGNMNKTKSWILWKGYYIDFKTQPLAELDKGEKKERINIIIIRHDKETPQQSPP